MIERQSLYGLTIEADFPLHQTRAAPTSAPVDVSIRLCGPSAGTEHLPDGRRLLHVEDDRQLYSAVHTPSDGYLLRFHGRCDFWISENLGEVLVQPDPDSHPGMSTILTTGAMLAFQLYLRGHAVLHASAVDVGGSALGFIGSSGMGKSTMASLLCADGAKLITDDVLRVDFGQDTLDARLGATELRLRAGADTLVARFAGAGPGRRLSADNRQVLQMTPNAKDHLPLAALVIPIPTRDSDELTVERLDVREAVFALINFPRLLGWQDQEIIGRHFSQMVRVAQRVPIYVARVPWGPPFSDELAAGLRDAVLTTS